MRHEYEKYEHNGIHYEDSYYLPEEAADSYPIVLVIPDYHGATAYVEQSAQQICELGYVACCVDVYGSRAMPKTSQEAASLIMPFFNDRTKGVERAKLALNQARRKKEVDGSKTAAIGYSSGGMVVLDMARRIPDLDGAILEWGVALPWQLRPLPMIEPDIGNAKVLIMQGTDDPFNPLEAVLSVIHEFDESKTDYQWILFGQKKHAYSLKPADNLEIQSGESPLALLYDAETAKRSHRYIASFLEELFN